MVSPEKPLSLSEFALYIKGVLSRQLGSDYWVIAEIGELKHHTSGHRYLELVEKENERIKAKIRANIWASTYAQIGPQFEHETGERLKNGMKILCCVRLNFHEIYGLSLNITRIDPSFTLGERMKRRQEILMQLEKENLLELNKTRLLSIVPWRVAIISSSQAAGYEDFMNQLSNNRFGYRFLTKLFPAVMQGDQSVKSIKTAFSGIADNIGEFDVAVLIRGGGSQLDLDTFDSYELAAAIARFPLPVLTGIGHERDETIADIVAHTRMKTPTAAAEFLVKQIMSFEESILDLGEKIRVHATQKVQNSLSKVERMSSRVQMAAFRLLESHKASIAESKNRLQFSISKLLATHNHKLEIISSRIEQHDPDKILKKGYTISLIEGKPIQNSGQEVVGKELTTLGAGFKLESTIKSIKKND